ncbi:MAG: glycoside hydrolase family 127 protein, partial [Solirubrobacterales bacterium]|nr:glycoside hydrolase family 127 protein [Solirubrobacterales bacterium]
MSRRASAGGPVDLSDSPQARLFPLRLGSAAITGGLWAERQRLNREVLLPRAAAQLEAAGNFDNLRAAARHGAQRFRGPVFMDSDVYKWLEAIGWELAREADEDLERLADEAIALVADAQDEDGYLNSYYQVVEPSERWSNLAQDHELYCAGHLIQAAIAQCRGRGEERLMGVA